METEQQPVSDEQLARQAQAGCLTSLEELVVRHETRIYRFVLNSLRHETDAREVTQETFVTACLKIQQFIPRHSFLAWLFTIARRKCIDRHPSRRPSVDGPLPDLPDLNDPARLLAEREAGENLWQFARQILPELQFHALWLRYAEDLSVADIARVLGRTQTYVKVLLFRARTRLAAELENQPAGGEPRLAQTSAAPINKLPNVGRHLPIQPARART